MTTSLLLYVGILAVLSPAVLAIKCHVCDSDELNYDPTDPCLDPFWSDGADKVTDQVKVGVNISECDVCVKAKGEINTPSEYCHN